MIADAPARAAEGDPPTGSADGADGAQAASPAWPGFAIERTAALAALAWPGTLPALAAPLGTSAPTPACAGQSSSGLASASAVEHYLPLVRAAECRHGLPQ